MRHVTDATRLEQEAIPVENLFQCLITASAAMTNVRRVILAHLSHIFPNSLKSESSISLIPIKAPLLYITILIQGPNPHQPHSHKGKYQRDHTNAEQVPQYISPACPEASETSKLPTSLYVDIPYIKKRLRRHTNQQPSTTPISRPKLAFASTYY